MKARTLKTTKVNVITMGCSKNTFDSEVLMAQLKANNITVDHENDSGEHNVVVINTCGFIENAKQESIDTILNYARAKDEGLVEKVYVTGCLSQRYAPELKAEIPQIVVIYLNRLSDLLFVLARVANRRAGAGEVTW